MEGLAAGHKGHADKRKMQSTKCALRKGKPEEGAPWSRDSKVLLIIALELDQVKMEQMKIVT